MKKIIIILLSLLVVSCAPKKIKLHSNEGNKEIVLIFFDPLCSYCKLTEFAALKEMGVGIDLVHHLKILDKEKSYGICYLYEAIKVLDEEIAWKFLESMSGVPENKIDEKIESFIAENEIHGKLRDVTESSGDKIEKMLLYDTLISQKLGVYRIPQYMYKDAMFSSFDDIKQELKSK